MSGKKKKKARLPARPSEPKIDGYGSRRLETEGAGQEPPITQYIFTFELIRQYPTVRSFIVKQPLKRSFRDAVSELFGGNKKGVYRI